MRRSALQPDKVSLLGDAIEYVRDLQRRLEELESSRKKLEEESVTQHVEVTIEKSISVSKIACAWRDGLLVDILLRMINLQLEVVDATAKVSNGVLKATLKAKVRTDITCSVPSDFAFIILCEGINEAHCLNVVGHELRHKHRRENCRDSSSCTQHN